ncbi:MAG: glycosyltransferase [Planctomycetota bacterium]
MLRARALRKLLGGRHRDPVIAYIWDPEFWPVARRLDPDTVVYHKRDRYPIIGKPTLRQRRLEESLIRSAHLKLAVSPEIIEADPIHHGFEVLENGVDFEPFRAAAEVRGNDVPEAILSIPGPRIGYVGSINQKLDFGLLTELVGTMPEANFVFVGPIQSDETTQSGVATLRQHPNVRFLGSVEFTALPSYVANLDVGLMPYRTDHDVWSHFCSPLKLPEYLAAGIPVVSSGIPAARRWGGHLEIADSAQEWSAKIHRQLRPDVALERAARIESVRHLCWSCRAADVLARLNLDRASAHAPRGDRSQRHPPA